MRTTLALAAEAVDVRNRSILTQRRGGLEVRACGSDLQLGDASAEFSQAYRLYESCSTLLQLWSLTLHTGKFIFPATKVHSPTRLPWVWSTSSACQQCQHICNCIASQRLMDSTLSSKQPGLIPPVPTCRHGVSLLGSLPTQLDYQ